MAVALLAAAGCHKKQVPVPEAVPAFTTVVASGSSGDTMAQMAQQYGIPLYPGANPDISHFNGATVGSGARVYLAYTTPDAPDKVISFYKGQMGLGETTSGAISILNGTTRNGSQIAINVGQKMDGSGTSFAIVVTPQPQQFDNSMSSNTSTTPAQTSTQQQVPPTAAPKDDTAPDATTYYVPTANSPDDGSGNTTGDDSQDQQSTGGSTDSGQTTGDQTGGQPQQTPITTGGSSDQSQDNSGPPGG